jgi:hypothetical protein
MTTLRVLLSATTDLIPSTFDKARFTFLAQPPQVILLTVSVAVSAAAVAAVIFCSPAIILLLAQNSRLARTIDFIIFFDLIFVNNRDLIILQKL